MLIPALGTGVSGDYMNTNCLAGLQCPSCGSFEPFDIVSESVAKVYDDGVEHHSQTDWSDDSFICCCRCSTSGEVREFKIKESDNA